MRPNHPLNPSGHIYFQFDCKDHPSSHSTVLRRRGDGSTSNIGKSEIRCQTRQQNLAGDLSSDVSDASAPPSIVTAYSSQMHRVLLSLMSAVDHRSYGSQITKLREMEVNLLRPGTTLPSASTLSRDTLLLHTAMAQSVAQYFASYVGFIHLALDGWTSPLISSFLGTVLIWYAGGRIHRHILEFTRYVPDVPEHCPY